MPDIESLNSITSNPPTAQLHITAHTTDWLWAAFALFVVFDLGAIAWSYTRPAGQRFFYHIPVIVLTVSSIAYLAMAGDLGHTPIGVEFARGRPGPPTRDVWYVRYIQWVINAPLILLEVLLTSGLSLSDIFTSITMTLVFIISGLIGALVQSQYKWGFYTFGVVAYFFVAATLLVHGPRTTFAAGGPVKSTYFAGAGLLVFIWGLYPLCWGLADGGNVIGPTGEMIWYSILDLISGPVFLYFFMFQLREVDFSSFALNSTRAGGPARTEKV